MVEAGNDYVFTLGTDSHHAKEMSDATITANVAANIRYENDPLTGKEVKNVFSDNEDSTQNTDYQLASIMHRNDFEHTWPQTRTADERKVKHIGTMHVRLYLSDREQKKYNLVFTPQKSMGSGYLQIDLSGEQSKVKASIISAVDLVSKTALNCRENKIYLNNIQKMQRNKVSFFLEYVEECSMEVTLFGYTS